MKKIVFTGLLLALVLSFTACGTTDEAKKAEKEAKKTEAEAKKEKKDNGPQEVSSGKEVTSKNGLIRIKVKPNLGTYNIAVVNKDEKLIPVTSTGNEYTSTCLYLKMNSKIYKLMAASNVNTSVTRNENGVSIDYDIPSVAHVNLNMDCIKSAEDSDLDMIKTTVTIKNLAKKRADFSLKQIIDTVLGEKTDIHFYSADNIPVKNEVLYRNLKNQNFFLSKNNSAVMQMLFNGGDATQPELLALANYSTLDTSSWEPGMTSYRSFDTVLSYNNSAVGAIWPEVRLLPDETCKIVYYLAFAVDGASPLGMEYVYGIPVEKKADKEVEKTGVEETLQLENSYTEEEPKTEFKVSQDYTPKALEKVDFNVKKLPAEKYSQEYIQKLLDRISELEKDSASVNREELLKLNQELDEILAALRE